MSQGKEIKHNKLGDTLVATARLNLQDRDELYAALRGVEQQIPEALVAGPGFCIFHFITSVEKGFDGEVGFPVTQAVEADGVKTRVLPGMEVLSLTHTGPADDLGGSYSALYGHAAEHGLISDEFCREVFPELGAENGGEIEIQFVIHKWTKLLATNVDRVLGKEAARHVMEGEGTLTVTSPVEQRFRWVKGAIGKLEGLAGEGERYDILSSCAHVFPDDQLQKLSVAYEETKARTGNTLEAVDAVIAFMDEDPGWGVVPRREGNILYSAKKPRDPKGYEKAENELERRKATCYCPLVREHLDEGMPVTFCYCGAGWFRQQWEAAIGEPVRVEILQSVLKGDDVCEFAIRLPDGV